MQLSPPDQLVGWVALCLVPRIGGRTLSSLLSTFGSPRAVFEASEEALLSVPLIGPKTVEEIYKINLEQVREQIADWQADGITLLSWKDNDYPEPWQQIEDRPPLVFARGVLEQDWSKVVAIVGTREPDVASVRIAETLGRELARRGWLIASGLARGIDAAAHRGAVYGGRSVAVLGSGVNNIQPPSSVSVARRLLRNGAIYAEVPPDVLPTPAALMARNRLISGLAKATIVVQAGLKSGSMEAARRARQQQRHVLTIDCREYEGNQELIRMEAVPLSPDRHDWDEVAALLESLREPPRQMSFFD